MRRAALHPRLGHGLRPPTGDAAHPVGFPEGRLRDRAERVLVAGGHTTTALLSLGFVASTRGCYGYLPGCPGSQLALPVLAEHRAVVSWVEQVLFTAVAAPALILLFRRVHRSRWPTGSSRRRCWSGCSWSSARGGWSLDVPATTPPVSIVPAATPVYYLMTLSRWRRAAHPGPHVPVASPARPVRHDGSQLCSAPRRLPGRDPAR
jgi:hypothetical protein